MCPSVPAVADVGCSRPSIRSSRPRAQCGPRGVDARCVDRRDQWPTRRCDAERDRSSPSAGFRVGPRYPREPRSRTVAPASAIRARHAAHVLATSVRVPVITRSAGERDRTHRADYVATGVHRRVRTGGVLVSSVSKPVVAIVFDRTGRTIFFSNDKRARRYSSGAAASLSSGSASYRRGFSRNALR